MQTAVWNSSGIGEISTYSQPSGLDFLCCADEDKEKREGKEKEKMAKR